MVARGLVGGRDDERLSGRSTAGAGPGKAAVALANVRELNELLDKSLGLDIPATLLARADEVIE